MREKSTEEGEREGWVGWLEREGRKGKGKGKGKGGRLEKWGGGIYYLGLGCFLFFFLI